MDIERLGLIYSDYREKVKPLMSTINARMKGQYPDNCLNEIRAMLDHVARCYKADEEDYKEKDRIISEELSKAEGHLRRLLYDCFKQLNILLFDAIHKVERKKFNSSWFYISGGEFWKEYTSGLQKAVECAVDAKKNESYKPSLALTNYDKAFNSYCYVESLLLTNKKTKNCFARLRHFFEFVNTWWSWLIVTVILSLISSLIEIY